MELSFLNAGLALGAALAAVPVILHLFMRQTPKRIVFPALRLIRERQKRSKKRLRVKNWLLLLARMALLALMALALARPTIKSEFAYGDDSVPCAIGMVFDTSLSMGYKQRDKTRLDEAKERALEILKRTPTTSQIYIVDSAEPGTPSPLSPAPAQKKVSELTLKSVSRPLNSGVGQAYAGVLTSELDLQEIYVFTDLAKTAWDLGKPVEGLEAAKKSKKLMKPILYGFAPTEPTNVAIVDAEPVGKHVTENQPLEIVAKLRSTGPAVERIAELWVDGVLKEKSPVKIEANSELDVRLIAPKIASTTSIHQGKVHISGGFDPLEIDDTRYFSFDIKPAIRVLIISDLAIDADFIGDAIDPIGDPDTPNAPRHVIADRVRTAQFHQQFVQRLGEYRCVFINNIKSLEQDDWAKLVDFARRGGGLVIALGQHSIADANIDLALPAMMETPIVSKNATSFAAIEDLTIPLFSKYRKDLDAMLATIPVIKYWRVKPKDGSRVLLGYVDKSPALIERTFKGTTGDGRILLWTTPLSRRAEVGSPDAWNEFPNELLGWSFYYLMNQTIVYLTGISDQQYNFDAGQDVILPIDPGRRVNTYYVHHPSDQTSDPLKPTPASRSLVIMAPQEIGNWTVDADEAEAAHPSAPLLGFSINADADESRTSPVVESDLKLLFGEDGYAVAGDKESFDRAHTLSRVGREMFPWFMLLIMIVVTVESILSNRFYKETPSATAVPKPAASSP